MERGETMRPIKFDEVNKTYNDSEGKYDGLPVLEYKEGHVSCWKMSVRERLKVLFTGKVWLAAIGHHTQPLCIVVDNPIIKVVEQ